MGFLNPVFLLAGLAVAVPIFLHLFYRRESKTFTFPAIRYLLRTERERSRQIRTQQLLLLLLRAAAVVLLVLLGARVHFPGPGTSHEPTALAVVIDNSLSTTVVEDGRRRLDALKAVARTRRGRGGTGRRDLGDSGRDAVGGDDARECGAGPLGDRRDPAQSRAGRPDPGGGAGRGRWWPRATCRREKST